jgi:amino acid transporter
MQIEAHDPHHQVEADLQDKGLSHNAVGLVGGTVLGISSVAPAYALIAIATWVAYRGITTTEKVQFVLVGYQLAMLGIMICFYYGLTAFAGIWYFRKELFLDAQSIVFSCCSRCSAASACSRCSS